MPPVTDPARLVEAMLVVPFLVMGLSHIARPRLWRAFFAHLRGLGEIGGVYRCFLFELFPATLLVGLHQVWHGPGLVLTLFGWLLMA